MHIEGMWPPEREVLCAKPLFFKRAIFKKYFQVAAVDTLKREFAQN